MLKAKGATKIVVDPSTLALVIDEDLTQFVLVHGFGRQER